MLRLTKPKTYLSLKVLREINSMNKSSVEQYVERYGRYYGADRIQTIVAGGRMMVESHSEGAYIYDTEGRRYLDFFCQSGVHNVGHRNPAVMEAYHKAQQSHDIGGLFYFSEPKGQLYQTLAETTPEGLEVTIPTVTGGEAIDLALKMAMAATGRTHVVCVSGSYHGSCGLSCFVGPDGVHKWIGLEPFPVTRAQHGNIESFLEAVTEETAAVIVEPIRSISFGDTPDKDFYRQLRQLCDAKGVKLLLDEVIGGIGRLGTLWGADRFGVEPDAMIIAKGLSGGLYPMSAVVVRPDMIDAWNNAPYPTFSTYAWSNVGASVATATIRETQRLLSIVEPRAQQLEDELNALVSTMDGIITDVVRYGLLYFLVFDNVRINGLTFANQMFECGVITHPSASMPNSPGRLYPPLILNDEHITECVSRVTDVLKKHL